MAENPTLVDIIEAAFDAYDGRHWGPMPGKVVSAYDASDNTVDVLPMVRHPVEATDGSIVNEDFPIIPACQVAWMQIGAAAFTAPLNAGDFGLLVPLNASISSFLDTGNVSNPGDIRKNHIANCIFIPGLGPKSLKPQYAGDPDAVLEPGSVAPSLRLCGGATQPVALSNLVSSELAHIAAAITQIAAVLNAPGPVNGAPGTVTPYVPSSVAAARVKAL